LSQEGAGTTKKTKDNIHPTKRRAARHSPAQFSMKKWPTWLQVGSNSIKNRFKIDAKINQKFDASWDRFLEGFGRFLRAKMRPC